MLLYKSKSNFKERLSAIYETTIFSIPIILSRLLIAANGITTALLMAHLGHNEFAAGTLVTAILSPLLIIFVTFLYSIGVCVGNAYGAEDVKKIGEIMSQGWLMACGLGIIAIVLLSKLGNLLMFFHQPIKLLSYVNDYLAIMVWGMLPFMFSTCCQQFLLAISKSHIVIICNCLNFIFIVILGYLFSFGKFGLPKLGMSGIAYANVLIYWIILIIQIIYMLFNREVQKYKLFILSKIINTSILLQLTRIGLPISIQFGIEWFAFSFSTLLIGLFGETALISQQITIQTNLIIMMIPFGISQACSILISRALGKGNYSSVQTTIQSGLILGIIFSSIIAYIYLMYPKIIISMYLDISLHDNDSIVHLTVLMFMVSAASQWFDSIRNITIGLLRGYFETRISMWTGILTSCFLNLPLGYFFGFILNWGAIGIKVGFLVGFALGAFVVIFQLKKIASSSYLIVNFKLKESKNYGY